MGNGWRTIPTSPANRRSTCRPFPNVDAGRWQVSNAGGSRAAWSRNGRELFYLNREGMLTSVAILPAHRGGSPPASLRKCSRQSYVLGRTTLGLDVRAYDVSPDGQRFLMMKEPHQADDDAQPPRMVVMLNWARSAEGRGYLLLELDDRCAAAALVVRRGVVLLHLRMRFQRTPQSLCAAAPCRGRGRCALRGDR